MEGLDGYSASVPLKMVMEGDRDALIVTHMNGQPLPPDHGFPTRVIVPGTTGARNVKWVTSIALEEEEASSCWQSYYYKEEVRKKEHPEAPLIRTIVEMPLQSLVLKASVEEPSSSLTSGTPHPAAIIAPHGGGTSAVATPHPASLRIPPSTIHMQGIAWAGATGNPIAAVDVSGDGGITWHSAKLIKNERGPKDNSSAGKHWAWTRWVAELPIPPILTDISSSSSPYPHQS